MYAMILTQTNFSLPDIKFVQDFFIYSHIVLQILFFFYSNIILPVINVHYTKQFYVF